MKKREFPRVDSVRYIHIFANMSPKAFDPSTSAHFVGTGGVGGIFSSAIFSGADFGAESFELTYHPPS